ncbi:hypothetical protein JG687_00006537 [Phytophthora cactorum]|uniref:Uncharacterized protein n=1 Tax=Phytophthora cactorum TaxID=29920 RepID=A0A8T1UHP4_9STRA|nr:hypothetical protein JG687_00006537 [Phytophthora cactorum]
MATENVSGWTALESRHAYSIEDIAVEDLVDDWEGLVSDETEAVEKLTGGILRASGDLELETDAWQICGGGSGLPAHASHSSGDEVQSFGIEVQLSVSDVPHDADDLPLSAKCRS